MLDFSVTIPDTCVDHCHSSGTASLTFNLHFQLFCNFDILYGLLKYKTELGELFRQVFSCTVQCCLCNSFVKCGCICILTIDLYDFEMLRFPSLIGLPIWKASVTFLSISSAMPSFDYLQSNKKNNLVVVYVNSERKCVLLTWAF